MTKFDITLKTSITDANHIIKALEEAAAFCMELRAKHDDALTKTNYYARAQEYRRIAKELKG